MATAMAAWFRGIPSDCAAGMTIGAWIAHCPPPEGIKKLTIPALRNVNRLNVCSLEMLMNHSDTDAASPDCAIMPMIPA